MPPEKKTKPMAMEMAMATLIGTIFNRKTKCTYPCTLGPCGCFRIPPWPKLLMFGRRRRRRGPTP